MKKSLNGCLSHVGFRVAWKLQAAQFGKEFRAFVDAQLAATPIATGQDSYAEFKRISQAESPGPGR